MEEQNVAYQTPAVTEDNAPLTLGNYLIMMIITAIPVVGFIFLLIWAFNSNTNKNKKNWARAVLIMGIIGAVLVAISFSAIIAAIAPLIASM